MLDNLQSWVSTYNRKLVCWRPPCRVNPERPSHVTQHILRSYIYTTKQPGYNSSKHFTILAGYHEREIGSWTHHYNDVDDDEYDLAEPPHTLHTTESHPCALAISLSSFLQILSLSMFLECYCACNSINMWSARARRQVRYPTRYCACVKANHMTKWGELWPIHDDVAEQGCVFVGSCGGGYSSAEAFRGPGRMSLQEPHPLPTSLHQTIQGSLGICGQSG